MQKTSGLLPSTAKNKKYEATFLSYPLSKDALKELQQLKKKKIPS
jgi:hypothetical protein